MLSQVTTVLLSWEWDGDRVKGLFFSFKPPWEGPDCAFKPPAVRQLPGVLGPRMRGGWNPAAMGSWYAGNPLPEPSKSEGVDANNP